MTGVRTHAEPNAGKRPATSSRYFTDLDYINNSFAIDGHYFVAIPHNEWSGRRKGPAHATTRPAGFVRLDGVRHVLIERNELETAADRFSPISDLLTSRELQIAYSVADGKCDKVIAHDLGISEYTVREHMRRIFHKLKVSKRAALVAQLITSRFARDLPRR
jgi:DNA-binding CsgD family transcriptional regulator